MKKFLLILLLLFAGIMVYLVFSFITATPKAVLNPAGIKPVGYNAQDEALNISRKNETEALRGYLLAYKETNNKFPQTLNSSIFPKNVPTIDLSLFSYAVAPNSSSVSIHSALVGREKGFWCWRSSNDLKSLVSSEKDCQP